MLTKFVKNSLSNIIKFGIEFWKLYLMMNRRSSRDPSFQFFSLENSRKFFSLFDLILTSAILRPSNFSSVWLGRGNHIFGWEDAVAQINLISWMKLLIQAYKSIFISTSTLSPTSIDFSSAILFSTMFCFIAEVIINLFCILDWI